MDGSMFRGLGEAIAGMFIVLLVCVPLAIWKMVDIVIWIIQHVEVGIK